MIVNLLSNDYISEYKILQKLIEVLKADYLSGGNDITKFTNHLEAEGICVRGMIITVDEKWDTYCILKGLK